MDLLWILHFPIFAENLNSYKPGNKCKRFKLFSIYSGSVCQQKKILLPTPKA